MNKGFISLPSGLDAYLFAAVLPGSTVSLVPPGGFERANLNLFFQVNLGLKSCDMSGLLPI